MYCTLLVWTINTLPVYNVYCLICLYCIGQLTHCQNQRKHAPNYTQHLQREMAQITTAHTPVKHGSIAPPSQYILYPQNGQCSHHTLYIVPTQRSMLPSHTIHCTHTTVQHPDLQLTIQTKLLQQSLMRQLHGKVLSSSSFLTSLSTYT